LLELRIIEFDENMFGVNRFTVYKQTNKYAGRQPDRLVEANWHVVAKFGCNAPRTVTETLFMSFSFLGIF
jgi:hypothetical protein